MEKKPVSILYLPFSITSHFQQKSIVLQWKLRWLSFKISLLPLCLWIKVIKEFCRPLNQLTNRVLGMPRHCSRAETEAHETRAFFLFTITVFTIPSEALLWTTFQPIQTPAAHATMVQREPGISRYIKDIQQRQLKFYQPLGLR